MTVGQPLFNTALSFSLGPSPGMFWGSLGAPSGPPPSLGLGVERAGGGGAGEEEGGLLVGGVGLFF